LCLENKIPELELGWEKLKVAKGGFIDVVKSHGGVFLYTQIMALIIGNLVYDTEINDWTIRYTPTTAILLLLFIDLICLIYTAKIIWWQTKDINHR
jgi:hypothetical protein